MALDLNWFQTGQIPSNAIHGTYHLSLVILSYVIAIFASYTALDMAGRLRTENNPKTQLFWLIIGAFSMGAGIWSMHFIGMLAFSMPMPADYDFFWTGNSMLVAILASAFALLLLKNKNRPVSYMVFGGILLGLGICTMHYMGMQAMASHLSLHYLPGLFILSVLIAIIASEIAIWLMIKSNEGTFKRQIQLKLLSAMIMGAAICGMHYTGMAATIFTPLANYMGTPKVSIPMDILAFFVAGITALILTISLVLSIHKQLMVSAIQTEKEFLNAILANLDDSIIACDANGNVTVANQILESNLGLPANIVFSKKWPDYFTFYDAGKEEALRRDETPLFHALNGERIKQKEYVVMINKKYKRNIIIDGQPIKKEDGTTIGAVIAIHDITDRIKMEKSLFQSEKMAVVGQFATGIAHELNQPLSIIRTNMQTLEIIPQEELEPQELLELTSGSILQVDRASEIINRLRALAKHIPIEYKPIDLVDCIESVLRKFQEKSLDNNIEIVCHFDKDLPYVSIDPLLFEKLTINLLLNAQYAIEEKRKKIISSDDMKITLKLNHDNEKHRLTFEVIDNGIGMTKEVLDHCLEPFFTAKEVGQGTGLGLTVCYNIVGIFNGTMEIKSIPENETIVSITFPTQ